MIWKAESKPVVALHFLCIRLSRLWTLRQKQHGRNEKCYLWPEIKSATWAARVIRAFSILDRFFFWTHNLLHHKQRSVLNIKICRWRFSVSIKYAERDVAWSAWSLHTSQVFQSRQSLNKSSPMWWDEYSRYWMVLWGGHMKTSSTLNKLVSLEFTTVYSAFITAGTVKYSLRIKLRQAWWVKIYHTDSVHLMSLNRCVVFCLLSGLLILWIPQNTNNPALHSVLLMTALTHPPY